MSTPAPDPVQPAFVPSFGGYAGQPGAILGVGFWPRVGARIIDTLVHYFVVLCASFLFGLLLAIAAIITHQALPFLAAKLHHLGLMGTVFVTMGSSAYHTICESVHGSTVGKLAFAMVVVQENGTPCRFKAALIRSLAYFVDGLFFGLIAYFAMQKNPQQQRHGDNWAHTIVCKRSAAPSESLRSGTRFVLALMLGAMADAALVMILLSLKLAL
jgi:uncharacterized RDD family membrane protein YckC